MKFVLHASICIAAVAAYPALANDAHHAAKPAVVAQADPVTEGEIRKIDREAKKVTLKHAPIRNLDMPAMTMVFQVADPAMLENFKAGDKVIFTADKVGGNYVVKKMEASK